MTISHQIRAAASLNAHSIFAGLSGGKEPPMHNPPVRRFAPPERPKPHTVIEPGDEIRLKGTFTFTYRVNYILGSEVNIGGGPGGLRPMMAPLSQVELVRKAKKKPH